MQNIWKIEKCKYMCHYLLTHFRINYIHSIKFINNNILLRIMENFFLIVLKEHSISNFIYKENINISF